MFNLTEWLCLKWRLFFKSTHQVRDERVKSESLKTLARLFVKRTNVSDDDDGRIKIWVDENRIWLELCTKNYAFSSSSSWLIFWSTTYEEHINMFLLE